MSLIESVQAYPEANFYEELSPEKILEVYKDELTEIQLSCVMQFANVDKTNFQEQHMKDFIQNGYNNWIKDNFLK